MSVSTKSTNPQLKASEVKHHREQTLEEQEHLCPICGKEIESQQAAFDHDHRTGHFRAVLHKNCNWQEGRIYQSALRGSRGGDYVEFVKRLVEYWEADYSANPIHPTHGKPKRRRRRKNVKRRK